MGAADEAAWRLNRAINRRDEDSANEVGGRNAETMGGDDACRSDDA